MSEENINEALVAINDCLQNIAERLAAVELYVQELPTPDKTYYKPIGYDDYLNVKGNYDEIYKRISALEEKVNGMQD